MSPPESTTIGGIVGAVVQRRDEFVLRVRNGKVTAAFLETVAGGVQENGVVSGWVAGERPGKRVRLAFGRGFPAGAAQQLRNVWTF